MSDMKSLRAKLLLPSILGFIAGVAGIYLLMILSHIPLAHIIYCNQFPVLDTVFIQLLTIVSRTLALPYTAYDDLSNQYSTCNLSIIHKRREKRNKKKKGKKKTVQEKRKSHKQEFRSREKLNDRMKTASYLRNSLSDKTISPTKQYLRNFTSGNSNPHPTTKAKYQKGQEGMT